MAVHDFPSEESRQEFERAAQEWILQECGPKPAREPAPPSPFNSKTNIGRMAKAIWDLSRENIWMDSLSEEEAFAYADAALAEVECD